MSSPTSNLGVFYGHAMAYDSGSDHVILFGGRGGGGSVQADTWTYDFNTNTWTNVPQREGPPGRSDHAMAYDSGSDRVILFGGSSDDECQAGCANLNDTWAYDFETNTWTNLDPVVKPPGQWSENAMAYDSGSDRVILFGGFGFGLVHNDTWAYDFETNTWTNLDPIGKPPERDHHAMAYDSESDRVVMFGGEFGWGSQGEAAKNDPWAYDFETNMWIYLGVDLRSRPRDARNLMAYDSESDRIILVTLNGAIWAYDYDSDTWTKKLHVGNLAGPHSIAYDSKSDRIIISGPEVELWAYDYNTNALVNMDPVVKPPSSSAMAYDSGSDRVILLGGNETWAYDFETNMWTNVTRPGGPPGLGGSTMAYDAQSDRIVLFGGTSRVIEDVTECSGDTWAYDFETNTWTNVTSPSGPIRRTGSSMVYDSDHDQIILYGGACFYTPPREWRPVNDTWAYDLDTNTWTNMAPSSDPGARWLHAMAYDSQSHVVVLLGGWGRFDLPVPDPGPWWYRYPESAPASPRSLQANEGNRQVTLTWIAPDYDGGRPITGYRIYRFTWPEGLSIIATVGLVLTYTDTGLTNGVLYYYWVSALNAIGDGTLSETVAATPRLTLSAPGDLQAAAGNGRVVLTWQRASSGDDSPITGYRIYRGTSLDSLTTAASVGNVLTYLDTDVTNGVTYHYRVSALIGADEGPRSREAMARPTESTKPNVAILSPADGTTVTSMTVIISGSASDDTAILRVELSRDGTNWVTVTGTTSWSGRVDLGEGTNTIHARATDTSGNTATMSISVTVSNPVLASLSSPLVMVATGAGIAAVLGAVVIRRWRDRRWERK